MSMEIVLLHMQGIVYKLVLSQSKHFYSFALRMAKHTVNCLAKYTVNCLAKHTVNCLAENTANCLPNTQ